jgi:hypothetical protein
MDMRDLLGSSTFAHLIPIYSSIHSILSKLPLLLNCVLFVLCVASLGEIIYLDHFVGSCAFVYALFK